MAATLITVTHTFLNIDQTPASGVVVFKLSARMTNGTTTYPEQVPVHATLNGSGQLSAVLPANNDPATTPVDSTYLVTFVLNGSDGDQYSITVPYDAPDATIDLGALLPQQVGE